MCFNPHAKEFITPLTFHSFKNAVFSEFTTDEENPRWNDHVSLLYGQIYL